MSVTSGRWALNMAIASLPFPGFAYQMNIRLICRIDEIPLRTNWSGR